MKLPLFFVSVLASVAISAETAKPVSYYSEIVPIFKKSCNGCHQPSKMKGDLDLTTHAALMKGGKHGPVAKPGDASRSSLFEEITGEEPSMPADGEPLGSNEVALIERWILEGAKDDTPPEKLNPYKLEKPPVYTAPPVISSAVYSPEGNLLAVTGYHEILLCDPDTGIVGARLVGESPKPESIAFSPDGKLLAVAGGAPAVFGEVQVWDIAEKKQLGAWRLSPDSFYGVSFSPDGAKLAFGGADKSVRVLNVADGKEVLKFDNHSDWVFGTTFTADGKRLLTASRDKAMKLINVENGQFIDDVNKLLEEVLCISRHPSMDLVAYGGEQGGARIYKISENQFRTAANNDINLQKEFERQPGAVRAIAYSPDGSQIAVGGTAGDVVIFKMDGARSATLGGHGGAVHTIAWHPKKAEILTAGYEGKIRVFNPADGTLLRETIPFPIQKLGQVAAR